MDADRFSWGKPKPFANYVVTVYKYKLLVKPIDMSAVQHGQHHWLHVLSAFPVQSLADYEMVLFPFTVTLL